ncbi:hypothetical protein [Brachybacterium paraconglomeratum]|uniref:hypothetical protein n=1 Tax=Brachybacterium paraconglomeratum TaxID=173362 RepID=UPI0022E29EF2|nr:hypothetical protein [Brachybacterium paraconglomeratum]
MLRKFKQVVRPAFDLSGEVVLRKFKQTVKPSLDPSDRKATLLELAASAESSDRIAVARHLARLRNFRTAAQIMEQEDSENLSFLDQCYQGIALLNAQGGLVSDELLARHLANLRERTLALPEIGQLGEWIQLSGMSVSDKVQALHALRDSSTSVKPGSRPDRDLRFRELRLRKANLEKVDVLDYFAAEDTDPFEHKDNLRYINDLVTHGHAETARTLLERQLAVNGLKDRSVVEWALRFQSGSMIEDLSKIPQGHQGMPGMLGLAHDLRAKSPANEEFFAACLRENTKRFAAMNVYNRDTLLRVLTVKDLLPTLDSLVPDLREIPDTMLGARCGRGLIAMEAGANRDSADLLRSVLEEDPAYTAAATGLRFVYARLDDDYSVVDLRNEIGYGATSAGRVGIRRGDRDQATTLILSGDYLRSWRVRRESPAWRTLKRDLGAKFLNYEELPEDPGSTLFLITDDGVGDEIRGAQHLGELATRYQVTATCDPRLRPLLERSFPDIEFVDVARRIRGIINPVYDGRYSDFILASHLPAHCDPYVEAADHVTFGQNLTFNRFAGVLPRQDTGAYLTTDPNRAVPRSEEKLKVGLVWKSHFASASRRMMYLGVEQFAPLLDTEGVEFWSVQHATGPDEVAYCETRGIRQIEDVDLFDDLEGLAAHVASMDLVIGISTVPMELAAAVGTPTWLLGFSPENYLYRTAGGRTSVDQLSRNSTIIAPPWIDFTASYEECVELVMADCRTRLERLARTSGRN